MAKRLNKPLIKVYCSGCDEWVNESSDDVEFLDISEGPQGEDIMTFIHRPCGKRNESTRRRF
jgi:hypothetical protein